ncbi:hypothetical protein [Streptomyces zaomyceticus]
MPYTLPERRKRAINVRSMRRAEGIVTLPGLGEDHRMTIRKGHAA